MALPSGIELREVRRMTHLAWMVAVLLTAHLIFGGPNPSQNIWPLGSLLLLLGALVAAELTHAPTRWPQGAALGLAVTMIAAIGVTAIFTVGPAADHGYLYILVLFGASLLLNPQTVYVVLAMAIIAQAVTGLVQGDLLALAIPLIASVIAVILGSRFAEDYRGLITSAASVTDPLTGLDSVESFRRVHRREHFQAMRYSRPYGLMLVRIDDVDAVVARHGTATARRIVAATGQMLAQLVRDSDALGRFGEAGFAILMVEADREQTVIGVNRIRRVLQKLVVDLDGHSITPTLAMGSAAYPVDGTDMEEVSGAAQSRVRVGSPDGDSAAPRPSTDEGEDAEPED